jgi:CubicO group peptidase (beta-lactamase class C family)
MAMSLKGGTTLNDIHLIQNLLETGHKEQIFSAAQTCIHGAGKTLSLSVGETALSAVQDHKFKNKVTRTTLFDIASLTKPLATSILLMQALDAGLLKETTPLRDFFPMLTSTDSITLELIASHQAGFKDHLPLFSVLEDYPSWSVDKRRAHCLQEISQHGFVFSAGTRTLYSDLGFLILGWILEKVFSSPIEQLFQDNIAQPLNLSNTGYGPVEGVVATTFHIENDPPQGGIVHDPNARALGGSTGHAGLFSTASDVVSILRHLMTTWKGDGGIVSNKTLHAFWKISPNKRFTWGWDTPTEPSSSGQYTTRGHSVGHLGFTGCSLWHDLKRDVTISLLTNRVHCPNSLKKIQVFRPRFHDLIHNYLFKA